MEGKVKLTGEQAKELTDYVEQTAAERLQSRAMETDLDFYCGAMAVIHFLTEGRGSPNLSANIPPIWILGSMSSRSPSLKHMGSEEDQRRHQASMDRFAKLIDNRELMYEYVVDMYEKPMVSTTPRQFLQERRVLARMLLEDIGLYDFWKEEDE